MKFRIDLKIFIFVILFLITNQIKIYAMIMIFAIIHELGHLIAGMLLGMKAEKIEIKPFGVAIDFNIKRKDYIVKIKKGNLLEVKKVLVALAGPMTNVLIIFILAIPTMFQINLSIVFDVTHLLFDIRTQFGKQVSEPLYPLSQHTTSPHPHEYHLF